MLLFPFLKGGDLRLTEILWYLEFKDLFVNPFVNFRLKELYLDNIPIWRLWCAFDSDDFCRQVQFLINPKIY